MEEVKISLVKNGLIFYDFESFNKYFAIPLVKNDGWRTSYHFHHADCNLPHLGILCQVHRTQVPRTSLPVWADDKFKLVFFVEGFGVKESDVYDVELPENLESCDKIKFHILGLGEEIETGSNWFTINIIVNRGEDGKTMIETTNKFRFQLSLHEGE